MAQVAAASAHVLDAVVMDSNPVLLRHTGLLNQEQVRSVSAESIRRNTQVIPTMRRRMGNYY